MIKELYILQKYYYNY